ncbi:hypothetical protein [Haloactinopolyspora alba]|nr:hypothetical protein [Haloactinopolyspora alba]
MPTVAAAPSRRHTGSSLIGQLNAEWARLCADDATADAVRCWARYHRALDGCTGLADVEAAVAGSADDVLLALLGLAHDGDGLAGRTVLQLMLGKAVRIAASHSGRDTRESLEHAAVSALWTTIATYPTDRRPARVAANIAMDTVRAVCGELAHDRVESPQAPEALGRPGEISAVSEHDGGPADQELIELLAWAVAADIVSAADATLIVDVYAPAPGEAGGAAAATRHGVSWPAARQRASRAIRKITRAINDDVPAHAGV